MHGLLGSQHIGRVTGVRIGGTISYHVAYLVIGIDLMKDLYCLGRSNELILGDIRYDLRSAAAYTGRHPGGHSCYIDLIEGQPILYLSLISLANSLYVSAEAIDGAGIGPGTPGIG
jgi:hypothetical protein